MFFTIITKGDVAWDHQNPFEKPLTTKRHPVHVPEAAVLPHDQNKPQRQNCKNRKGLQDKTQEQACGGPQACLLSMSLSSMFVVRGPAFGVQTAVKYDIIQKAHSTTLWC